MFTAIQEKFNHVLWDINLNDVNIFQAFLIQTLRILYGAVRDLAGGLPSLRAMGLVYTTLLSLVPLLAVSFSVLKGFGAHNQLEPALLNFLEPLGEKGLELSGQIISFVDNINVGVLGSIGLLVLVFTVLSLVKKIESAFNFTWRIRITRNIFQRFSNYLSVILVGPLLLFTAAGITASFHSSKVVDGFLSIEPFGTILLLIGESVPYVLTIITFTLIYILIPNTKVRFKSALCGAVVATILWKSIGALFTTFIVNSTNYTAIYSGFAILIIFMLWIYISWLIVLTGASIAYYYQHPDRISEKSQIVRLSCRLREKLALTIMQIIASDFHYNKTPHTLKTLASQTGISDSALTLVTSALIENQLITTTGKDESKFMPAQSLENITLDKIISAARSAEETQHLQIDDVISVQQVDEAIENIEDAIHKAANNQTLKDLISNNQGSTD